MSSLLSLPKSMRSHVVLVFLRRMNQTENLLRDGIRNNGWLSVACKSGAGYSVFAGREAARALAKMSLREEDCTDEGLQELSKREQETLRDWEERLLGKYSVVGQASGFRVSLQ